jgi:large subunit ribosomal protein L1
MTKFTKKQLKKQEIIRSILKKDSQFSFAEAVEVIKSLPKAKFDETVDISFNLNVDPRHADQMIRGALVLPHGLGKTVRVMAIAKGESAKEAIAAGALRADEDLIVEIQNGFLDFDVLITTPDMMASVGKLGKILAPRGLMPSPKTGTVTTNVRQAVKDSIMGRVEYKTNKAGMVQMPAGKVSFESVKIVDNLKAIVDNIIKAKPATVKSNYIKSIYISSTMGPGVKIESAGIK